MTDADLHTLTGAYALDVLESAEAEAFARHLAECEACAREVVELRETAARLARAVATPPPEMHDRVIEAIARTRQLPPQSKMVHLSPRRWRRNLPYFLAAACLAVAAAAGGLAFQARQQADQQRQAVARAEQQASQVSALLAASDAQVHSAPMHGGGTGTVVASARLDQAAFFYHQLPALSGRHVYELWYSVNGHMVPAGLVDHDSSGAVLLNGSARAAAGVGVTVEPAGGSPHPTTNPVLLLPVGT